MKTKQLSDLFLELEFDDNEQECFKDIVTLVDDYRKGKLVDINIRIMNVIDKVVSNDSKKS